MSDKEKPTLKVGFNMFSCLILLCYFNADFAAINSRLIKCSNCVCRFFFVWHFNKWKPLDKPVSWSKTRVHSVTVPCAENNLWMYCSAVERARLRTKSFITVHWLWDHRHDCLSKGVHGKAIVHFCVKIVICCTADSGFEPPTLIMRIIILLYACSDSEHWLEST